MINDICRCTQTLIPNGQHAFVFSFDGIYSKFIMI
jgi:hypothetical protein